MDILNTPGAPLSSGGGKKFPVATVGIIGGAALLLILAYLWYAMRTPSLPPPPPPLPPVAEETASASLGGEIYGEASNPVKGRIPDAGSPAANPIEGAYQNPFE